MTAKQKSNSRKEKVLRSSDVRDGVGLSYRQLNDWDSKGILASKKRNKSGWRKFTAREVFVLMVCKEIRDKFGVPLEKLSFIKSFMLQKDANHYQYAFEHMAYFKTAIYLLTDLKEEFIMDTDLEIEDLFHMGMFGGSNEQGYILLKINPLINKMLTVIGVEPCDATDYLRNIKREYRNNTTIHNSKESEILKLIRDKKYRQVTVHMKDGEIIRASTEEELSDKKRDKRDKELLSIIRDKKYQSISLKVHDGKIVRLSRTTPIKLDKGQKNPDPHCC